MVGTFADPITEGAMAVFRTREAAEEFVADDPFVTSGAVGRWYLREWNEASARSLDVGSPRLDHQDAVAVGIA